MKKVHAKHPYWPEASGSLGDVLQYDREELTMSEEARVRTLIGALNPKDLESRVRFFVSEMPWDFPIDEKLSFDEREKRQVQAVEEVARDLLKNPAELQKLLPELSTGYHRKGVQLGFAIAEFAERPLDWEGPIRQAFKAGSEDRRNFGVLVGFYAGLAVREPSAIENFKKEAAKSPVFAVALPYLCLQLGITPSDVALVCAGLKAGIVPVNAMASWGGGGVFAKLAPAAAKPLFDQLFAMDGDAYSIALDVMGMYVHGAGDRLEFASP